VTETAATYLRLHQADALPALLPPMVYTILAPFTGTRAANEFIDGKLSQVKHASHRRQ
jgi:hypothetical protein